MGDGFGADGRGAGTGDLTSVRRFLDMSTDLRGICDLQTNLLEVSDSCERVLGWSRRDLIGTPLLDYVHPEDVPLVQAELASVLTGADAPGVPVRLRCKDGSYRWVQGNARPVLTDERIYVTAADLTDRKALEDRNEELERFAYSAAHDLKAPLALIEMALAATPRPDGEAGQLVDVARRGAGRMRQLIEDLLTFAAVGRATSAAELVALDEVLDQVLADLAPAIAAAGAEVTAAPLPQVWGHRTLLGQLLQNLVGNSLTFVRPDTPPRIEVSGADRGSRARVRVADNGIGIVPERRSEVFGVFTRLNPDDRFPGSGIGLATCAKVVAYHGGQIGLEDGIDGGIAVVVDLPVGPPAR